MAVHGKEWSFGWTDGGSGLWDEVPGECGMHTYKETVSMGWTRRSPAEIDAIIASLKPLWQVNPGRWRRSPTALPCQPHGH